MDETDNNLDFLINKFGSDPTSEDLELKERVGQRFFEERKTNLKDYYYFTYDSNDGGFYVEYPNGSMILADGYDEKNKLIKIKDLTTNETLDVLKESWDDKYFNTITKNGH